MNLIKSNGIVIRKSDIGEADRFITVFTEEFGKVNFIIKGIRKSKKRDQTSSEILTLSNFIYHRKGEYYTLDNIDTLEYFYDLKIDIEKLQIGLYMVSVLDKILVEGQRKKDLYQLLYKSLDFLNNKEYDERKNKLLILHFLYKIIKDEGIKFIISGSKFLNVENSNITEEYADNSLKLSEGEFKIIRAQYEGKIKEIIDGTVSLKDIENVIFYYEKYLNYHLEIKLEFKKYFLEAWNG